MSIRTMVKAYFLARRVRRLLRGKDIRRSLLVSHREAAEILEAYQ